MNKTLLIVGQMAAFALAQGGIITPVADRASLAANDLVAWGAPADEGNSTASPYARTSVGGLGVVASIGGDAGFLILVEGSSYGGNFSNGDVLLDSNFVNGPITIVFAAPVSGVGLQIQRDVYGAFSGSLSAFGAGDVLFGTLLGSSTSGNSQDGSGLFLGLKSSLKDIKSIRLNVSNNLGSEDSSFAVNQLSLLTTGGGGGPVVPEPSTLWLVAPVLAGLAVRLRRRA